MIWSSNWTGLDCRPCLRFWVTPLQVTEEAPTRIVGPGSCTVCSERESLQAPALGKDPCSCRGQQTPDPKPPEAATVPGSAGPTMAWPPLSPWEPVVFLAPKQPQFKRTWLPGASPGNCHPADIGTRGLPAGLVGASLGCFPSKTWKGTWKLRLSRDKDREK